MQVSPGGVNQPCRPVGRSSAIGGHECKGRPKPGSFRAPAALTRSWVRESEDAGRGTGFKTHRVSGLEIWWSLGNFGQGTKKELVSRMGGGGEWEIHRGFNYSEGVEDPAVGVGVEAGEGPYRERGQGWEARVLERPQPSSRTQPIFRA